MKKRLSPESEKGNYLIFARKFRPETFEEVIGQDTITQLLRNAIRAGRIPQSFLFAGPRGIGKTSTARILAKALNCSKGPAETPCNECVLCDEITRAISLDVLEIDGASNRGIDEIRNLRENVKFKPAQARFKIYIIDEVHMLTGEAFNALLKTLEEPPEHVKFVFATTEPHKVPLTILSRCQRFNFRRIPTETIAQKLTEIAKSEHLKPEAKALFLMARASDGSLRDAEMLLDQLSVLSKGQIREADVLFALGLASEDLYLELLEALHQKEAKKVLSLTKELYESGKDLVQFGRGLYELFRNLLLLQIGEGAESFVEMTPESKDRFSRFKASFSREEILLTLSLLQNLQGDLRRAIAPPKLLLENALLKILHLEGIRSVKELLEKVDERTKDSAETISEPRSRSLPQAREIVPPPLAGGGIASGASRPRNDNDDPQKETERAFTLGDIERVWPQVIEAVKAKEMSTGMFLAEAGPIEVADQTVVLGLPEEFQFHKEMLERTDKKKLVERIFSEFLGRIPQIQFVTTRIPAEPGKSKEAGAEGPAPKVPDIVRQAMDIFQGSKIVRSE